MKRTLAALVLAALSLSGCAQYQAFQVGKGVVRDAAADVADNLVRGHLWALCQAMPVGAIRREFKNDQAAYKALCAGPGADMIWEKGS